MLSDLRLGVRHFMRRPALTFAAVLSLALGIGVSTAIFSVIDATMLRPLPYFNPEQLVSVSPEEKMPDGKVSTATASMEDMGTPESRGWWQRSA